MHRHSSCDYSSHAFAQPSGRAQTTFRSEADGENEPGHGANVGRARLKKNLDPMAWQCEFRTCLGAQSHPHSRTRFETRASNCDRRSSLGGRRRTRGAQSRSQKLALRAAPRYQHRCQNGLPWPTEVFFQEGGIKERCRECWAPLSEQMFGALIVYLEWRESLLTYT